MARLWLESLCGRNEMHTSFEQPLQVIRSALQSRNLSAGGIVLPCEIIHLAGFFV